MDIDMNKIDVRDSLTITIPKETTASYGTSCIVCDEYIPLDNPFDRGYRICNKCKRAILKMRECMKEN